MPYNLTFLVASAYLYSKVMIQFLMFCCLGGFVYGSCGT